MAPSVPPMRRPARVLALAATTATLTVLALGACRFKPSSADLELQQRQEQLELKLQQLEQRLNAVSPRDGADPSGKPPAGPVKSLTYRTGDQGNRLRIYWSNGSTTDLECNQEQSTLACG